MITQIDSNLLAENVKTKKNGSIRIHSGFFCCACYNLLLPLKTVRTYTKRIKKNKYTKNNTQQVTCFRNKCSSIFFFYDASAFFLLSHFLCLLLKVYVYMYIFLPSYEKKSEHVLVYIIKNIHGSSYIIENVHVEDVYHVHSQPQR